MNLTRRNVLGGISVASFAYLFYKKTGAFLVTEKRPKTPTSVGKVFGIGTNAPNQIPNSKSVLTIFDSNTQNWAQHTYDLVDGHSIVRLKDQLVVIGNEKKIQFIDESYLPIGQIALEEKKDFGGHGVYLQKPNVLLLGLRQARDAKLNKKLSEGELAVVDPTTMKVIERSPCGGLEPHDMHLTRSGELLVVNYGNTTRRDLYNYKNIKPSITVLDPVSLKIIEKIPCPELGSVSHIAEGPGRVFAALPAQLYEINQAGIQLVRDTLPQGSMMQISPTEMIERKVATPSPILLMDHQKEVSWQSFMVDPLRQRRPQSVIYHPGSKAWFVTYPFSDTIAKLHLDGRLELVSAFTLGLSLPRGVLDLGDKNHLYVSGQYKGLIRLNANTLQTEQIWEVPFGNSTHLFTV